MVFALWGGWWGAVVCKAVPAFARQLGVAAVVAVGCCVGLSGGASRAWHSECCGAYPSLDLQGWHVFVRRCCCSGVWLLECQASGSRTRKPSQP